MPIFTTVPTQTPAATTVPQNRHVVYVYDGDGRDLCTPERSKRGNLVKSIIDSVETYYPNTNYQLLITGSQEIITKFYSAGSSRIAYRINGEVTWLLNDHLGSTVGTVNEDGELIGVLKYTAYGELRTGSSTTDYKYTGQREESEIGLYYYVARFYDPATGKFISPDSLLPDPGSVQGYDRYGYVNGNPILLNDPSGNIACEGWDSDGNCISAQDSPWIVTSVDFDPWAGEETIQPQINDCGTWAITAPDSNTTKELDDFIANQQKRTPAFYDSGGGGLQPSELAGYAQQFFPNASVQTMQNTSIEDMYTSLQSGNTVVVDIMVGLNSDNNYVVASPLNTAQFSHFAKVVKVDLARENITLINSVQGGKGGLWSIDWRTFFYASSDPEGRFTSPLHSSETVNQWTLNFYNPQ
jgi:RHS repeat-associated protein